MADQFITLAEMAKREGFSAPIAEELNKKSAFLGLLPWEVVPGGVKKYGVRAALPGIGFRGANETIYRKVSVVNPYEESMIVAENNPWVDKAVITGDPAGAVAMETLASIEKIRQIVTTSFIYGDKETDPKGVDGLSTRLLLGTGAGQVVNASGSGTDTMSIWVLRLAPGGVQGFCASTQDLLQARYLGEMMDPETHTMGYGAHVFFRGGLAVCDANAAAQVANIESSGSSNILTMELIHDAIMRVNDPTAIFANRTAILQIQKLFEGKAVFANDNFGRRFLDFGGIPVYREDNLTITETAKT